MEAPRRPEPSLVGAGGRRRAHPRDGTEYLAGSGVPDQLCTQGTAERYQVRQRAALEAWRRSRQVLVQTITKLST